MRTKVIGLLVALAFAASAGSMRAQEPLSRAQGLMITRMVLSTEAALSRSGSGSPEWRSLSEIMKSATDPNSGFYIRDLSAAKVIDSSTLTVLDYTLQLTRSDDNEHFQFSLTPTGPKDDDRLSWFSDDRAIIYTGKPLR
jgi:hypothetical protein